MKNWSTGCLVLLGSVIAITIPALGCPQSAATQQDSTQQSSQQAQSQAASAPPGTSIADAARHAREQKKDQTKTGRVWDNDNLPKTGEPATAANEAPSTAAQNVPQGQAPNATGSSAAPATTAAPATPGGAPAEGISVKEKAQLDSAIAEAKEKIDDLKKDLDIAQRKFALDSDTYYGKPNYAADPAGKAALDAQTAAINDLKQQVQQAEQMLAEMQAKLGPPPTTPKQ